MACKKQSGSVLRIMRWEQSGREVSDRERYNEDCKMRIYYKKDLGCENT